MTKPNETRCAPRAVLGDALQGVERAARELHTLLPELRRMEIIAPHHRRQIAHEAVAQAEIALAQIRDAATRLDAAKSLVRAATEPGLGAALDDGAQAPR